MRKAGSLQQYLEELHDEYGDIIGFWHGTKHIVSVANVKYFAPRSQIFEIPDVLFEGWRPLVGDSSFIFSTELDIFSRREKLDFVVDMKAKQYFSNMFSGVAKEIVKKWSSLPEGQHIPLTQHLKGLATKAVCRMLLGDFFRNDTKVIKLHKAWEHCWTYVESVALEEDAVNIKDDFSKNLKILQDILEEGMNHRFSKEGNKDPALLDVLLASSKPPTSESQLLSDAISQLTIGMHVTHSVLLWTLYFVATHPEVQDKLRAELSKSKDPSIMPETIVKNKYMQCVLKEAVRCGSIFLWTGRKEVIDIDIEGHLVPKNTPIIEAIGEVMVDENIFTDPAMFDPDRFDTKEDIINPLEFIPFAFGGSRKAPEDSLVYVLAAILVCHIIRDQKLGIAGDNPQNLCDPDFTTFVSQPSKEELWAVVSPVK